MSTTISSNLSSPSNITSFLSTLSISPELSRTTNIVYLAFRTLWSLFSLAGNSLTIIAVFRFPLLRAEPSNLLISSLAFADMIGALLPFLIIPHQMVLYGTASYVTVCLLEKMLAIMSTRGNALGLVMIASDRFISINYPLRYPGLVTSTRVSIALGMMWVWTFIETPLVFFLHHRLTPHMTCKYFIFLSEWYRLYYMPQALVYITISAILYAFIARIAIRQRRLIENSMPAAVVSANASGTRKQRKVAKMMSLVLGVYLMTYMPSVVVGIMLNMHETLFILRVEKVTALIFWMGIWVNPLIYAWKSRDFRRAFRRILHLPQPEQVN